MAEDWLADVRKYAPHADEGVVAAIVRHCGIALQTRDASLVSFNDKVETDRVRESYLKKKLGLTDSDATLDAAITSVGHQVGANPTANRVTVYYLLTEKFHKLGLFGGTEVPAATVIPDRVVPPPRPEPVYTPPPPVETGGGLGWLKWLIGLLILLGLLFFGLRYCSHHPEPVPVTTDIATTEAAAPVAPVVIPTGAGVIAADQGGRPMLKIFFDTAHSEVTNDLTAAAANVTSYLDSHPGTKLAVSGYNDPTGNAAANAELSKHRAENVQTALEKLGVPADRIELVKPADTTPNGDTNAEARRVDVVVTDQAPEAAAAPTAAH